MYRECNATCPQRPLFLMAKQQSNLHRDGRRRLLRRQGQRPFAVLRGNRTGRFAGRLIQVQNLPQNHLPDLAQARWLAKSSNFNALDALYDSVPVVLPELVRIAFVPKPGNKFIVADQKNIFASIGA